METVIVRGNAPPRTRVVRDTRFGSDDDAVSDASGAWAMVVELDPGPNSLRFRLEDDRSTEVDWIIVYEPSAAEASPTLPPAPTQAVTPPTAAPTSTPQPTPPATEPPTDAPTAPPTDPPTPEPTEAQADTIEFFDDIYEVGSEIPPGTYRTRSEAEFCYWARLSGFSGELDDITANSIGPGWQVVTIGRRDAGFESSRCGLWTSDLSQVIESDEEFGEGTLIVGTDVRPGQYAAPGGDGCYWARLSGFGGTFNQIIANDFITGGRARVRIPASDAGFTSNDCGTWTRQ